MSMDQPICISSGEESEDSSSPHWKYSPAQIERTVSVRGKRQRVESGTNGSTQEESSQAGERNTKAGRCSPAKNWCFTFNNYKENDPENIHMLMGQVSTKWCFQEETGESGTPHLQGAVSFKEKVRPMGLFKEWPGIHWELMRNEHAAFKYASKEDTRTGKTYASFAILSPPAIRGWQVEVKDLMRSMVPRNIYWFYEETGGIGKSTLTRNLCMTEKCIVVSGKAGDMKHGIATVKDQTGDGPEFVICDIPRTAMQFMSYGGMEEVANGCFFSTKYESAMVIVSQPKIICFANCLPDYSKMSKDRWQVYKIDARDQRIVKL